MFKMKKKVDDNKRRSVTTPNIQALMQKRNSAYVEEEAKNLIKVNPFKLGRSSSVNVFMEYGGDFSDDPNPINVKPPVQLQSQAQSSQLSAKNKIDSETEDLELQYNNSDNSVTGNQTAFDPLDIEASPRDTEQVIIEPYNRETNKRYSYLQQSENENNTNNLHISETPQKVELHKISPTKCTEIPVFEKPIPNLKPATKVLPKSKKYLGRGTNIPKTEEGLSSNASLEKGFDGGLNKSPNSNVLSPLDSDSNNDFESNLKFSDEGNSPRRDATVIYTKKSSENDSGGSSKEKHNEVKSNFGPGVLSSRNSVIIGRTSIDRNHHNRNSNVSEFSKDEPYKSPTPTPESESFSKKGLLIIIVSLVCIIVLLISGFVPAIYQLSKGTHDSINNYFQNRKNLPHLHELVEKYLYQQKNKFDFGTPINTIEGLNEDVKNDSEVVSLMSSVSNLMFHGIAYSPINALEPYCGFAKHDAMLDLAKLSTITTRIRTYGMQCDQADLILDAIEFMNLNMTLAMGVWIGSDDELNKQQMDQMKKIIARLPEPSKLINSIYIGNEVLFREDKTEKELIGYIRDAKNFLKIMNIDDIAVGTSEIGSLISSNLLKNCDVIGANIHPFFGGIAVEDAIKWTLEFLDYQVRSYNEEIDTHIVISEVGWPSGGGSYEKAYANKENLKYFISEFLCILRNLPIEYYFFEAFDEPWKQVFWSPNQKWETQWGIFNSDRSNKFSLQNLGCI
ncbi:btgC [Candida jiufengensis]|uniref:btgC n=1 Tax=Candida jiufengensis TaxID=497108 RepID=UPI0022259674|nr:btgC [Candida jiufengensis]KAI5955287.1 btgC [Candida jiufengensis]